MYDPPGPPGRSAEGRGLTRAPPSPSGRLAGTSLRPCRCRSAPLPDCRSPLPDTPDYVPYCIAGHAGRVKLELEPERRKAPRPVGQGADCYPCISFFFFCVKVQGWSVVSTVFWADAQDQNRTHFRGELTAHGVIALRLQVNHGLRIAEQHHPVER